MKVLSIEANDQEILDTVREWVNMLIEERYVDACSFFRNPHHWTPELMSTVIQNYGSLQSQHNGKVFKVTSLENAKAHPSGYIPHHDVNRLEDDPEDSEPEDSEEEVGRQDMTRTKVSDTTSSYMGYVWFDLPLNGHWSDLTATLDLWILNNQLVIDINDIHVM